MTSQPKTLDVARVLAFAQRLQLAVDLPRIAAEVERELADALGAERVELCVRAASDHGLATRVGSGARAAGELSREQALAVGEGRARAGRDAPSPADSRLAARPPTRVELAVDGASLGWLDIWLPTSVARETSRAELAYLAALGDQSAAAVARVRLADERIAVAVARERRGELRKRESAGLVANALIHDFKNLMTVIAWRTEALHGGAVSGRALDLDSADAILEATKRGSALARRLQIFGRRADPVVEAFDLVELVDEVAMRLCDWLDSRDAVRVEHATATALVVADRWQVARFLIELILHARDSASAGATVRLGVRDSESGTELELVPGVADDLLERACKAFCAPRAGNALGSALGDSVGSAPGDRPREATLDHQASSHSLHGPLLVPGAPGARVELRDDGARGPSVLLRFPHVG
ncbi:MAG: HAMP domain-containing histidine kinase [Planctomycetes bacterium]|nr:HAMP domain-containing histidine kinase [Planctomycetota bacterium]